MFVVFTGMLAACGGGPATNPSASGVVTGYAEPCVGPFRTQAQISEIPVRVTLEDHSRVVASQTVRGSHTYRLTVPPGRYRISTDAASRPVDITVHSGGVVRTDLISSCR